MTTTTVHVDGRQRRVVVPQRRPARSFDGLLDDLADHTGLDRLLYQPIRVTEDGTRYHRFDNRRGAMVWPSMSVHAEPRFEALVLHWRGDEHHTDDSNPTGLPLSKLTQAQVIELLEALSRLPRYEMELTS